MDSGEKEYHIDNWFTKGCHISGKLMVKKPDIARVKRKNNNNKKIADKERKLIHEHDNFMEIKKKYKKSDPQFIIAERKYRLEIAKLEKEIKYLKDDVFVHSIKFSRFNVEPYEIAAFANLAFIISILAMMILSGFILIAIPRGERIIPEGSKDDRSYFRFDRNGDWIRDSFQVIEEVYDEEDEDSLTETKILLDYDTVDRISILQLMLFIVIPTLAVSMGLFVFISNYPEINAKRLRTHSLGSMPETINYMSISMRLIPSLHTAIEFASNHLTEPLASDLRKTLWNVYTKRFHSIEESFIDFIYSWREVSDDFERSLYQIRSAVLERTKEGVERNLDKANSIILEGTKQKIELYSSKLSQPIMILFSIGILLPIMITTMLPVMGIGAGNTLQLILGMLVFLPLLTYVYCYTIVNKRPGTIPPPVIKMKITKRNLMMIPIALCIGGSLIGLGIFSWIRSDLDLSNNYLSPWILLGPLPILWGITFIISFVMHDIVKIPKLKRDRVRKMEEYFPDSLYQIGSRVGEGHTLEKSMQMTSNSMKGTLISNFLSEISQKLQISKDPIYKILFGITGTLTNHPSRLMRSSFKAILSAMDKDNITAGNLILGIANYQKELKRLEWDMENKLDQTMSTMTTTVMIFAPIILGITTGMFFMISGLLSDIDPGTMSNLFGGGGGFFNTDPMDTGWFTLIMGSYIIIILFIINNFASSIKYGYDRIESLYVNSISLPVATVLYSVSIIIVRVLFPG